MGRKRCVLRYARCWRCWRWRSRRSALAGAQHYELLSASVRASLAHAVSERSNFRIPDRSHPRLGRRDDAATGGPHFDDEDTARQFLALARYEAMRAGLDPQLVLAVVDVESQFHKYAVSRAGARGYMQVMPFWVKQIGRPGQNLFQERTNLRYGCTILRYYLDRENGNLVQRARPLQRQPRAGRLSAARAQGMARALGAGMPYTRAGRLPSVADSAGRGRPAPRCRRPACRADRRCASWAARRGCPAGARRARRTIRADSRGRPAPRTASPAPRPASPRPRPARPRRGARG